MYTTDARKIKQKYFQHLRPDDFHPDLRQPDFSDVNGEKLRELVFR